MLSNVRLVLIVPCLILLLEICHTNSESIQPTNEANVKAKENQAQAKSPVTSYYRHNIYGPNTYAFGFEVNDKDSGNKQFRDEKRYSNGSVQGSYGYLRPDGSVSITHFMADPEQGYLSQTQNFEPGDHVTWADSWPTKKPNILMNRPQEPLQPEVKYDDNEKLNLTSILLPVQAINEEHGIDLNPSTLEKELVNPAVLEVINGEAPLVNNNKKKADELGFATINNFIPADFPIVPFELPQAETDKDAKARPSKQDDDNIKSKTNKYNEQKLNNSEKLLPETEGLTRAHDKYVKSKENNAEKSIPAATLRTSSENISKDEDKKVAKGKSLAVESNDWYDRIINQARQKYLQNLK